MLWTLLLRAISIEFSRHLEEPALAVHVGVQDSGWRAPCCRSCSAPRSATWLKACRSVEDGWFELPLFTDFTARSTRSGSGLVHNSSLASSLWIVIAGHGGLFLAWKTTERLLCAIEA